MSIEARFHLAHKGFDLDVALELPGQGITGVFGPSGSGKTTLLRCIAGLSQPREARLYVAGECWQDTAAGCFRPPHRRALGYVFQDARLFAHRSVRENLRYGLRRTPPDLRRLEFDEVVHWLGLHALLARRTGALSGGEQQRVAIARALLTSPALLLMDEPLSALDAEGRAEILPYLEHLRDALAIPVLYVSHALDEVARLADHLVVLNHGRVLTSGELADVLTRLDLPLSRGDIATSVLEARVTAHDDRFHLTHLAFAGGELALPREDLPRGRTVRVRIAARDVSLALDHHEGTSILNVLPATVTALADDGLSQLTVKLDVNGAPLLARITRKSGHALGLEPGKRVYAQIKSVALI